MMTEGLWTSSSLMIDLLRGMLALRPAKFFLLCSSSMIGPLMPPIEWRLSIMLKRLSSFGVTPNLLTLAIS